MKIRFFIMSVGSNVPVVAFHKHLAIYSDLFAALIRLVRDLSDIARLFSRQRQMQDIYRRHISVKNLFVNLKVITNLINS